MNPVLRKDLLSLFRLRRVAAVQAVFVALLGLLVMTTWPQSGVVSLATAAQDSLLIGLIAGQMVLLVLFVPGVAAVGLSGEREAGTLEMLYASRLKPAEIIIGKIGSAVSFPILLLISGMPFVALLAWRGAVDTGVLAAAYGVLVVGALLLAAVSLCVSALSKTTSSALVVAYVAALILCGGVMVPAIIMLDSQQDPSAAQALHYIRSASPVAAVLSVLKPGYNDLGGVARQLPPAWQIFLPAAGAGILLCAGVVVAVLRKPPSSSDMMGGGQTAAQRSLARRLMYLIDPKKQRPPLGGFNPVIGKERRTGGLGSGQWLIRIFYGCLALSLGLALMSLYGGAEHSDLLGSVAGVLVALQIGVVVLVVPSLTSSAVSAEIESTTFEMLRMTRLSGGQIFWGKLIPALGPAVLPVIGLLPAYGAVCFIDPAYVVRLGQVLPLVLLTVALCATTGLAWSTLAPVTARATVGAYLTCAALIILPLPLWWVSQSLLPLTQQYVALPSSLVMALNLLPGGSGVIASLYMQHVIVVSLLCLGMLAVARFRLNALMRMG